MRSSSLPRSLALAAVFVFAFLFLAPGLAPVRAQSPDLPIGTTISIAPDVYAGLAQVIRNRPAEVLPGSRLLITSLDRKGGWAIATVALEPEQPDEGESILAHSTLALVRLSAGKWSGAVLGSGEYEKLLTAAPDSLVGSQAKPFLRSPRFTTQQNMVTSISTSLKWPFPSGQTWKYTQGRHGTANASVDLAPYSSIPAATRAVVAAAGGVVIRRCDDDVQSSVAIRHSTGGTNDEVTGYLHMNKNTVSRPTGSTIKQGETIGITYNSPIASQPGRCGYSTGPHVHFSTGVIPAGSNSSSAITLVDFAGTTVSGWQLGTDNCFTKGSERRCPGADFLSDNAVAPSAPTAPSNPSPADGTTLARTNNTVLSWTTNGTTCDYHIWGGSIDLVPPSGSCASFSLGERRGGSYQWQVTAHNSAGATAGPIWHFNIRPYAPSNLVAAAASSTSVNLSWTKSTDDPDALDNYRVYRANGTLLATLPAGSTTYPATGLACSTAYTFLVKAVRQGVESVASNQASATTSACSTSNVVSNPGFESGPGVAWQSYSKTGTSPIIRAVMPHTGAYSANFCGYNACTEYIQQKLTVPAGSPSLSYWFRVSSTDSTTTAYDTLAVRIYSATGTLLATVRTRTNMATRNTWVQDSLSLSNWAGQEVILVFFATTNASAPTTFYVDDVSITSAAPPPPPACYTLTTAVNPAGSGTVSATPAPNCNSGTGYTPGTAVTLTAAAGAGYTFGSWTGCDSSSGLTCQVTMNSNRTVTATLTPTVVNPLVNPGFESGRGVGWLEYSKAGFSIIATKRPHTGAYSAYLCEYNSCTEYIQQQVTIPAAASSLSYWRYMSSVDSTTTAYDLLAVRVYSSSGILQSTLRTWSNTSTRNTWLKDTLNISAYRGQTIYLVFIATTNATNATAFFVDDVSIQ